MWFTKQDSKITYKGYEYCTKIKLIKLLEVCILQCYNSILKNVSSLVYVELSLSANWKQICNKGYEKLFWKRSMLKYV